MEAKKKRSLIILGVCLNAAAVALISLLIGFVDAYIFSLMYAAVAVLIVVYAYGIHKNTEWVYKAALTAYYLGLIILSIMLALVRTGFISKFYNENGEIDSQLVTNAISGSKSAAGIFILISFFQVTFIPIPSTVTTVIGAALFGFGKGLIFSLIGQVAGSMVAFYLGRFFGKSIIVWIVGRETFEKYNKMIKGRDKIIIVFMMLFPLFPDDLICMFAGLTTFSGLSFFLIVLISRLITISVTSAGFSIFDAIKGLGGWSYVIYIILALIIIVVFYLVWKKGDIIEEKLMGWFEKIVPDRLKKKNKPSWRQDKNSDSDDLSNSENSESVIEENPDMTAVEASFSKANPDENGITRDDKPFGDDEL